MVAKTITITEQAYKALVREKKEGESFSELILRLTRRGRIKDCFGTWKMMKDELRIFSSLRTAWKTVDREFRKRLGAV